MTRIARRSEGVTVVGAPTGGVSTTPSRMRREVSSESTIRRRRQLVSVVLPGT
jgi:hypothetical protein